MNTFVEALPIFVYLLLIIVLLLVIVICVKLLGTINRVDQTLDDVNGKLTKLNTVFGIIDGVSNKVQSFYSLIADAIIRLVDRITHKKGKDDDLDE